MNQHLAAADSNTASARPFLWRLRHSPLQAGFRQDRRMPLDQGRLSKQFVSGWNCVHACYLASLRECVSMPARVLPANRVVNGVNGQGVGPSSRMSRLVSLLPGCGGCAPRGEHLQAHGSTPRLCSLDSLISQANCQMVRSS